MVGIGDELGLARAGRGGAAVDSPVVERMKQAGAIPIGRTNCPDMALRVHTDSGLFGLTRNPWHPGRTAGGSSGGEASALAARHDADRPRQRHRRIAAQSGDVLRHRIAEAVRRAWCRAAPSIPADDGSGVVPADAGGGTDGAPRRRRAPRPPGARRTSPPRSVLGAGAARVAVARGSAAARRRCSPTRPAARPTRGWPPGRRRPPTRSPPPATRSRPAAAAVRGGHRGPGRTSSSSDIRMLRRRSRR